MDYAKEIREARKYVIVGAAVAIIAGVAAAVGFYNSFAYSPHLEAVKAQRTRQQEEKTGLEQATLKRWEALGLSSKFPGMEAKGSIDAYCANPQLFTPESRGVKDSQLCDTVGKLFLVSSVERELFAEYRRLDNERAPWSAMGGVGALVSFLGLLISTFAVNEKMYYRRKLTKQPA